jgi:alkanesulfonate monooxygenase SsuD/methylene tetrahydromethanopterin reductase-like flavin-dependent oxidoreductase (luciferase family)
LIEAQDGVGWEEWLELARAAETAGIAALFRTDHYLSIRRPPRVGSLDAWTSIAAAAAVTERIRLGSLVSPVTFRPAAVLAKSVVTADRVSGGRVELGIGAGWFEAEHRVYGLPFPPTGRRLDELEAQLETINRHWSDADDEHWPKPVQRPRPPVIVGGLARPRSVRLAVAHADEYNTYQPSVDEARERRRAVDEAARAAGRAPLRFSIMRSYVVGRDRAEVARRLEAHEAIALPDDAPPLAGTVGELAEQLRAYADVGVERVMLQQFHHEDVEMLLLLGELVEALR